MRLKRIVTIAENALYSIRREESELELAKTKRDFEAKSPEGQAHEKAHRLNKDIEAAIGEHSKFATHAENAKHSSAEHFKKSGDILKSYHSNLHAARTMLHHPDTTAESVKMIDKLGHDIHHKPEHTHPEYGHILHPKMPSDLEKKVNQQSVVRAPTTKGKVAPKGFLAPAKHYSSREDLEAQEKQKAAKLKRSKLKTIKASKLEPGRPYASQPRKSYLGNDDEEPKVIPKKPRKSRSKKVIPASV